MPVRIAGIGPRKRPDPLFTKEIFLPRQRFKTALFGVWPVARPSDYEIKRDAVSSLTTPSAANAEVCNPLYSGLFFTHHSLCASTMRSMRFSALRSLILDRNTPHDVNGKVAARSMSLISGVICGPRKR